ncbi:phosphomannomutase/phosphoglucomutase [Candidatus Woesearchaeota archaeon]|nr:phosphomannomutase/phosphoglucomutase [Candidatus Woesearchaeota archaeon]
MLANPKIFKAYDIRGEWNKDWDNEFVSRIGLACALYLKPKTVAIGRDMRHSSEEIFKELAQAFNEAGVDVLDLGWCGTELTYFASSFVPEVDLALMITASHNPSQDNGIKVTLKNSISLGLDSGLAQVREVALAGEKINSAVKGKIIPVSLWPKYHEHVLKLAKLNSLPPLKVVIDAGNGIGGFMFDQVLKDLPIEVIKLFWNPDGNFPNHIADPLQEKNVEELKKKVVEEKADLGIAYDGDGDRIFFIDENGRYIPGYYTAALLTDFMLQSSSAPHQESIAHDPRYYWATKDTIIKHGAASVPSKVGHTLIKAKMRECNSLFSAECSGHIFYRENNFAESSMLTTLLVLKLLSEKGALSKQADYLFEQYPISGEINFVVENVLDTLQKIEQKYANGEISKLDGLGIDFPEWRASVRSSNTQPLLRLNVEAREKKIVEEKVAELKELIGGKEVEH